MPSQIIPNGWIRAKISDISIKGLQRKPEADERFTYVDIGSIDRKLKKISGPQVIVGAEAPSRARKVIENGDVLVSLTRPNLNAVALVSQEYHQQIASTGFEVIKPVLVDSRYIFALVRSKGFVDQISGVVQGALYPAAKSSDVQNFEFPLPPLAEQKVIADKLDTLLAQVENTKARLERIPQILKRFRQSVLAAAVSGRLTESEQSDWTEVAIGDLVYVINGKAFPSKDYQDDGVRLLRPGNLHVSGEVMWNEKNTTYIPRSWLEKRPELLLASGALLMNLTAQSLADEFLGRACMFYEVDEPVLLNQRICSFESKLDYDIRPYLFVVFRSPQFRMFVDTLDTGTLIKHLNVKSINSFRIRLPKREEQTEIVRRVDQLFAHADRVGKQVNNTLARVNNLTQSILAKAFRGELTEQWRKDNSDLISGENSAEALLKSIKAARVRSASMKRRR